MQSRCHKAEEKKLQADKERISIEESYNGGELNLDGGGSLSFVVSKRMLMINPVYIRICI